MDVRRILLRAGCSGRQVLQDQSITAAGRRKSGEGVLGQRHEVAEHGGAERPSAGIGQVVIGLAAAERHVAAGVERASDAGAAGNLQSTRRRRGRRRRRKDIEGGRCELRPVDAEDSADDVGDVVGQRIGDRPIGQVTQILRRADLQRDRRTRWAVDRGRAVTRDRKRRCRADRDVTAAQRNDVAGAVDIESRGRERVIREGEVA